MLPRVMVRVRKAVHRLSRWDGRESMMSGVEATARWHALMWEIHRVDREAERRLAAAERALNRLNAS